MFFGHTIPCIRLWLILDTYFTFVMDEFDAVSKMEVGLLRSILESIT